MPQEKGTVKVPSGKAQLPDIDIYYDVFKATPNIENSTDKNEIKSQHLKPTMIFLHGGPGIIDHNMYVPFWSQLSPIADVHFLDLRGHGLSGGQDSKYQDTWCLRQWADDLVAYCEARKIDKPIVVGFSFGTWIAYDYLTRYPQHASKVLFVNGEPWVNVELRAEKFKQRAIQRAKKLNKTPEEAAQYGEIVKNIVLDLKEIALGHKKAASDEENTATLYIKHCIPLFSENPYTSEELATCTQPNIELWQYFDIHEYYSFDYRPLLEKLKKDFDEIKKTDGHIPEIFMICGEYDPEHPPEGANNAASLLDGYAKCMIIPNTGDPVYRDKPSESLELLKACISYSFNSFELNATMSRIAPDLKTTASFLAEKNAFTKQTMSNNNTQNNLQLLDQLEPTNSGSTIKSSFENN